MKKYFLGITTAAALSALSARAELPRGLDLQNVMLTTIRGDIAATAQNMINWKVGDYQDVQIEMMFGKGTGHKEATKEDTAQNAVWLQEDMNIMNQAQKVEALISRVDGKTLKLIVNGKEESPDQGKIDIIEQKETSITVPAGTFDCLYVKAKTTAQGQEQTMEIWANPVAINLDGALKVSVDTQFGAIVMSLTKFGSK